jgi:hypothetical protein
MEMPNLIRAPLAAATCLCTQENYHVPRFQSCGLANWCSVL